MQKKFTITGLGICYGQVRGCEALIDAIVTDTPIEGCAPDDASYAAIREALKDYDARELSVISNVALDTDLQESFAFTDVCVCKDLGEMLETAKDSTLLLAGNEKGYLALLLTQEEAGFSELSVSGEGKGEIDLAEEFLTILTVALEIRYALCLREAPSALYRFWDCADKRTTTIDCGSFELTFTETEVIRGETYESRKYLLPVVFTTVEEAKEKLQQLKISAANGLYPTMMSCLETLSERTADTNTIVLAAENVEMLSAEIDNILSKSDRLLEKGFVWQTRNGSIYICRTCADPKVVFMNPPGGLFNVKVFYKFFFKLYGAMSEASRFVTDKHYTGTEEGYFSRALFDMVVNYTSTMLLAGIGIHPDILSGICQGELSMEYPYMKSKDGSLQNMHEYLAVSMANTIQLCMCSDKGPLEAYLGRKVDCFAKYYLKADLKKVREALKKYDSVFIITASSAEDIIAGGEGAACRKLIEELGCMATELPDLLYVHTPVLEVCREEIRKCILDKEIYMDVDNLPFKIFSTYYMTYMTSDSKMLADNLENLLIEEVDYSEVPKVLYQDGARVFIDLSPSLLCDAWVRTTLRDIKDAQVVSVYGNEVSGIDLLGICAKMLAANVPFEYEKLLSTLRFADDTVVLEKQSVEKQTVEKEAVDQAPVDQVSVAADTKVQETKAPEIEKPQMQNAAELRQYIQRQMAINEEAFRLYMNAQNNLYEQMLGAMAVSSPAEAKTEAKTETKIEAKAETKTEKNTEVKAQTRTETKTETKVNIKQKMDASQKPCLWDREQIITMTDSSMSAVLGDAYKEVDQYPVRARMPLPPFLFVSRITEIDAEFGVLRPGRIVAEYDFDEECVFRMGDRRISSCVAAEASHIGIFLMGYMGLDAMFNGTLSFRALDCNQVYLDERPFYVGDTMRTVFTIHRFAQNGPTTILYYDYETWNGDTLVSRSVASGGFFTQAELASNKGVIAPKIPLKKLEPKTLLHYGTTDDVTYTPQQITAFYQGDPVACFGKQPDLYEPYYLQQKYDMQMLERVTKIDYNGGKYGRGFISGEKTITPDLWPFDVHFKNDPVFPGIVMIDGVTQMELFLAAQTGALFKIKNGEMRMITDQPIVTKFRGQVRRGTSTLRYELHVKEAEMKEDGYYLTTDVAIFNDEVQVINIESFGLKVVGERID